MRGWGVEEVPDGLNAVYPVFCEADLSGLIGVYVRGGGRID